MSIVSRLYWLCLSILLIYAFYYMFLKEHYANKFIDLHLHLDGALTLDIAKKLASLQNITLPTKNDEELLSLLTVPDDCETVELAKKYLVEDGGVVAIDIAGAEALYPTSDYKDLFAKAKGYNIPFTIHAGEADGPQSVKDAIEFGAKRIGHGVRIEQDPEVEELVKEKGITLEMCPTSNRQTHAVEDISKYPLMKYLEEGIKVTLNTDDMGIEGTTLENEFRYMEKNFGLTAKQEKIILMNSVDAAFTSEKVKKGLKKKLKLNNSYYKNLLITGNETEKANLKNNRLDENEKSISEDDKEPNVVPDIIFSNNLQISSPTENKKKNFTIDFNDDDFNLDDKVKININVEKFKKLKNDNINNYLQERVNQNETQSINSNHDD